MDTPQLLASLPNRPESDWSYRDRDRQYGETPGQL